MELLRRSGGFLRSACIGLNHSGNLLHSGGKLMQRLSLLRGGTGNVFNQVGSLFWYISSV